MEENHRKVDAGFSAIYQEYEDLNRGRNKTVWQRQVVYNHLEKMRIGGVNMLEINAGSGIDSVYFAKKGFHVLATDLSHGAEQFYQEKKANEEFLGSLVFQQLSFNELDKLMPQKFDFVFSNFGGLNCIEDPYVVLNNLSDILNPGGIITVVIMPKLYPREWFGILKNKKKALRRLKKGPIKANVEGELINVWYHSLRKLRKELKRTYHFMGAENLGVLLPQNDQFGELHPSIFRWLLRLNHGLKKIIPASVGDYYVATFKKKN